MVPNFLRTRKTQWYVVGGEHLTFIARHGKTGTPL